MGWLASRDPEPTLSPPPCVSGAHNTAYPEKCWKLGAAPGGGPVFPVSCRVPCSPVQACAFMSEEPERAPSILTARAGAGQVRTCAGGVRWRGGWGRCVHVCVYTEPEGGQGDPCLTPSSQAVIKEGFGARQPWVTSPVFPIPGSVTLKKWLDGSICRGRRVADKTGLLCGSCSSQASPLQSEGMGLQDQELLTQDLSQRWVK